MSLTPFKPGSFRELWTISVPLMLSSLSLLMMLFIDRLLLSHYSLEAHNAAVSASTLCWSFLIGWISFVSISEVFVAQYNGAGLKSRLGEPVWQMIWVSIASLLFFIPLGVSGGEFFYGNDTPKRVYFEWMMLFSPSFVLYTALTGFFIGQGKTKLITALAIVSNFINAIVDYLLIFGVEGYVKPMGIEGAAIATSAGSFFQVFVLSILFLSKNNRKNFGTGNFRFNVVAFWNCVSIGVPNAIFITTEVAGWAAFYWMMTAAGEAHITIAGICQDLYFLFYFVGEGVNKAAIVISGNLIGANRRHLIDKMLKNGVKLHLYFFGIMLASITLFKDFIIGQFLPHSSPEYIASIFEPLTQSLYLIAFYIFFEAICFLYSGVLTAAGDVFFLLVSETFLIWILLILPVLGMIWTGNSPLYMPTLICLMYAFIKSGIYYWRYREGKWKALTLSGCTI